MSVPNGRSPYLNGQETKPKRPYKASAQQIDNFTYENRDSFQTSSPPRDASESLVLYRNYSREIKNSDNQFEANIRGWLFQSNINRKGKIMAAAVERLIGNPGKYASIEDAAADSEGVVEGDLVEMDSANGRANPQTNNNEVPSPNSFFGRNLNFEYNRPILRKAASTIMDMYSNQKSGNPQAAAGNPNNDPNGGKQCGYKRDQKNIIKERLSPVFHRSLAMRDVQIMVESEPDSNGNKRKRTFWAYTDESGRFAQTCRVPFKPFRAVALAGSARGHAGFLFIPPKGISVISDVDDTVRHSGVTKSKRELLQNILAKGFDECKLAGVSEWYNMLAKNGAHFHYVSNSPWQIYDIVLGFLKHHDFPDGAVHLKKYNGVFDGITEPVRGRKRATLDAIFRDFPDHKFIMIGDSGEADLEAYAEVASKYPNQVLAIYIRDITLPAEESLSVYEPSSPLYAQSSNPSSAKSGCSSTSKPVKPRDNGRGSTSSAREKLVSTTPPKYGTASTEPNEINSPKALSMTSPALTPSNPSSLASPDLIDLDKAEQPPVNRGTKPTLKPRSAPSASDSSSSSISPNCTNSEPASKVVNSTTPPPVPHRIPNSDPSRAHFSLGEDKPKNQPLPQSPKSPVSPLEPLSPEGPQLPPRKPPLPLRRRASDLLKYTRRPRSEPTTPKHSPDNSFTSIESLDQPHRSDILKRTSSRLMEGAFSVANASSQAVVKLLAPPNGLRDDYSATVRKSRSPNSPNADDVPNPLVHPSSEFLDSERVDKRVENWKERVRKHHLILPKSVKLMMWRVPEDVEECSIDVLKQAERKI